MDYRSAGLIMLSAFIMWAQHGHDHLRLAQLASEVLGVRHQACVAAERLALERNRGFAALDGPARRLPPAFPALNHGLAVLERGVATVQRTLDEVRKAALLFGWEVLGDERALAALLALRQPEPALQCPWEPVAALQLGSPLARASFALRTGLTP